VKTTSGATAVQIVHSSHRGSRDIEHIGSAHDEVELELLTAAARQRMVAGQGELDLGLDAGAPGGPPAILASRMGCLLDSLGHAYRVLGFDRTTGGDEVFGQVVLARIIEPVSKLDSARVLEEAGVPPAPYRTVTRRLRAYAKDSWRQKISAACAAHAGLGSASLVLYDVSTLYFETDEGTGSASRGSQLVMDPILDRVQIRTVCTPPALRSARLPPARNRRSGRCGGGSRGWPDASEWNY
jgi:hypothetical protein